LLGGDAEAALDQSEVLAVLAEQHRSVAVVVEVERGLRRRALHGWRQFLRRSERRQRHQAPTASTREWSARWRGLARAPIRLFPATAVIVTGAISPISDVGAMTGTGCE